MLIPCEQEITARFGSCQDVENFGLYRQAVDFDSDAFGRRVASARAWIGLKPKVLASAVGRTPEAINAIERGDRIGAPDKLLLSALAASLNVSEEWLLSGTEPPWLSARSAAGVDEAVVAQALETLTAALRPLLRPEDQPGQQPAEDSSRRRRSA